MPFVFEILTYMISSSVKIIIENVQPDYSHWLTAMDGSILGGHTNVTKPGGFFPSNPQVAPV
jgi:hypothetical protein